MFKDQTGRCDVISGGLLYFIKYEKQYMLGFFLSHILFSEDDVWVFSKLKQARKEFIAFYLM